MDFIINLIREYGVGIVFLNVLIEQLGAPIPAYPVLMVTSAIHGESLQQQLMLVAMAVVAALIADYLWYVLGRRYGRRVSASQMGVRQPSCNCRTRSIWRARFMSCVTTRNAVRIDVLCSSIRS